MLELIKSGYHRQGRERYHCTGTCALLAADNLVFSMVAESAQRRTLFVGQDALMSRSCAFAVHELVSQDRRYMMESLKFPQAQKN